MFPPIFCSKCYRVYKGYKQILFHARWFNCSCSAHALRWDAFWCCAAKCYVLSLIRRAFELCRCWLTGEKWSCSFHSSSCGQWCLVGWKGAKELRDYGHLEHPKTPMKRGATDLFKESNILEWQNMIILCSFWTAWGWSGCWHLQVGGCSTRGHAKFYWIQVTAIRHCKWFWKAPNDIEWQECYGDGGAGDVQDRDAVRQIYCNPLLSFAFTPFTPWIFQDCFFSSSNLI